MVEAAPRPAPAWAHGMGVVNLRGSADRHMSTPLNPTQAMQEAIHRYCWAFNERRADLLLECFTADASWGAGSWVRLESAPSWDRQRSKSGSRGSGHINVTSAAT